MHCLRSRPTVEQWSAASAEALDENRGDRKESLGQQFFRTELGRSRRLGKNQYLNLDYTPKDLVCVALIHSEPCCYTSSRCPPLWLTFTWCCDVIRAGLQPTRRKLHTGYTVPSIFKGDALQSACHPSLPHRWLMLSAKGSGSEWHIDPYNASAWNGMLTDNNTAYVA